MNRIYASAVLLVGISILPISYADTQDGPVRDSVDAVADEQPAAPFSKPRQAAEAYVAAALEGRIADAMALADPKESTASKKTIETLREVLRGKSHDMDTVHVSQKGEAAMALSGLVDLKEPQPDGQGKGPLFLLFTLARIGGAWVVSDIDIESKESAAKEIEAFRQQHSDSAIESPGSESVSNVDSEATDSSTKSSNVAAGPLTGLLVGNSMTIACSADGKRIAFANSNPTRIMQRGGTSRVKDNWKPSALILDVETGKTVVSLELSTTDEDAVLAATERVSHLEATALAFSPDGKMVAVGTSIGQVKVFNAQTGHLIRSLDDEEAKLADEETPENWKSLRRAMGSVASLNFSPDGSLLAMCGGSFADFSERFDGISRMGIRASGPGRLKVWDVQTGTLKHDLAGHNNHATAVAFSPDGNLLASAGRWYKKLDLGNGVILWNSLNGTQIRSFRITANGGARSIAFSPDSKQLAIGTQRFDGNSSTGGVSLVRVSSGITDWLVTVPGWAKPLAFSSDGTSIAVLSGRESIQVLDTKTGATRHEFLSTESLGVRWDDLAAAPQHGLLAIAGVDDEKRGSVEFHKLDDLGAASAQDEPRWKHRKFVRPGQTLAFFDPRPMAEAYIGAVLAGNHEDVWPFTSDERFGTEEFVNEFREVVGLSSLEIEHVRIAGNDGLIVSEEFKLAKAHPDVGDIVRVVITATGGKQNTEVSGGERNPEVPFYTPWLITDVDLWSAADAVNAVESFGTGSDAKPNSATRELGLVPYRFHVGDELQLESRADPTLDRSLVVQPDGMITLPQLGQVKAAGWTVAELREQVDKGYKEYYRSPSITITPTKVHTAAAREEAVRGESGIAKSTDRSSPRDRAGVDGTLPTLDRDPPTGIFKLRDDVSVDATPSTHDAAASAELETLRANYQQLEHEAARLIEESLDIPVGGRLPDMTSAVESELTEIVRKAFEARQKLQRAELAAFRQRMAAIEKQIEDRERIQDEIIQHRVDELLNPNLKWDPTVDGTEARDSSETARADDRTPAVSPVASPQFEINAYFTPTVDSPTRTEVATSGESVFLVLDLASPKRQSLTGLTISIQLDESLKPQATTDGHQREGNQLTWQNQSVKATSVVRYAVECLCLQAMPSIMCRVTVTDARGQQQSREVFLHVDPGETSQSIPPPPTEDNVSQSLNGT